MDQFELAVLSYICGPAERFVSPQFDIAYENSKGGSCPDFVVIDFAESTIYVVEVTQASDTKPVLQRIAGREKRWFGPLRNHFQKLNPLFKDWDLHVTLFVRGEEAEPARRAVTQFPDVSVITLDNVVFSWRWDWKDRHPSNPLRNPEKPRPVTTA
jgi:hypothetical protein